MQCIDRSDWDIDYCLVIKAATSPVSQIDLQVTGPVNYSPSRREIYVYRLSIATIFSKYRTVNCSCT